MTRLACLVLSCGLAVSGCLTPVPPVDGGTDAPTTLDAPLLDARELDARPEIDAPSGDAPTGIDAPEPDASVPGDAGDDASSVPDAPPVLDAGACPAGSIDVGGTCTPIPAPRLIAPLSTATTTSRRPTFRWSLTAPAVGAVIEICSARMCSAGTVETTFTIEAGEVGRPTADLSPGVHFWRAVGRAAGTSGTAYSRTWEVFIPPRSAGAGADVDTSWGSVGDYNGDGVADVLIAAPSTATGGTAYVFDGARPGGPPTLSSRRLDPALGSGSGFGYRVSSGDVNGDGFADAIVSAHMGNRIILFQGSPSGLVTPGIPIVGPEGPGSSYGAALTSVGDIHGDGYADVAVGAYTVGTGGDTGVVHVYRGSDAGLVESSDAPLSPTVLHADYGYALTAADFNADGLGDLAVAQIYSSGGGSVVVYRGTLTGLDPSPIALLTASSRVNLGNDLAAGDFDGNGYADIAAADQALSSATGVVHVFRSSAGGIAGTPVSRMGFASASSFGVAISVGDVNADGFADLAVGAQSLGAGRAFVYAGSMTATLSASPVSTLDGTMSAGQFGLGVSIAGDSNGDGRADLLVGEPRGAGGGGVYVFRGTALGVAAAATPFIPAADPGDFGRSVY